jgi:hypothetical protein
VSGCVSCFLIGFLTVLVGSIAAAVLVRRPTPAPEPCSNPPPDAASPAGLSAATSARPSASQRRSEPVRRTT